MASPAQRLTNKLAAALRPVFVAYAVAAAFATYFCMYAFRKPFAAARPVVAGQERRPGRCLARCPEYHLTARGTISGALTPITSARRPLRA
jgi:hypothetical protein